MPLQFGIIGPLGAKLLVYIESRPVHALLGSFTFHC
jgi:hypothetical protein